VVHPWITTTEEELQIPYLITLGLVETIFDHVVDRVKMVLVGATTIKRERVPYEVINELVVFYGTADDDGAGVGVDDGAGVGGGAATGAGQHEAYIDEILNLMHHRHWEYLGYNDPRDKILYLNFYADFLHRYNQISDEVTMSSGKSMSQLLDDSVWDDDMIDNVRGIRPTPGGMDWIDAKWILTVMNTSGNHLVTLEILLHEELINIYDCNLVVTNMTSF
ncbi:hypothetical protein EJD97_016174, partial [Solanum chilense]